MPYLLNIWEAITIRFILFYKSSPGLKLLVIKTNRLYYLLQVTTGFPTHHNCQCFSAERI